MGKYLDELRRNPPGGALTKPTKGLLSVLSVPPGGVSERKPETSVSSVSAPQGGVGEKIGDIAGALKQAIDSARDWGDLNQICVDNQAAFEAKLIDGDTSYHLAGLVLSRARVLPERAPLDEQVIRSEALYTRTKAKWGA